jgi:hypothetical protein
MQVELPEPEARARTAQHQRELARKIADVLERGECLDSLEYPTAYRKFAANILRLWADNHPDNPPRARGRAPTFPSGSAALMVAFDVAEGMSRRAAIAKTAEFYGVSTEAITKAIKPHRAMAESMVGPPRRKKGTKSRD